MILKNFQLNKFNFNNYAIYLLYGKNNGFQNEIIEKYFLNNFIGEVNKYDEYDILENQETILSEILNKSLFSEEKLLIISRTSDKSFGVVEELLKRQLTDTKIIFKSARLEKKSKLRSLFEKNKKLVIIPFYEDDMNSLLPIINNFLIKHDIKISREAVNLLMDRANGSREALNIELEKIYSYSITNKNLKIEVIKKLTNLTENIDINTLVDEYLIKNTKHVNKILNENNYSDEDCILILRTILNKSKRLLSIIKVNQEINDIDKVMMQTKPPIFWKDKENVKKQVRSWEEEDLKNNIYKINEVETLIKSNSKNAFNIVSDFIINS